MSMSSLRNGNGEEAAEQAASAAAITGKFNTAFTYFKYDEEKTNFMFGFFGGGQSFWQHGSVSDRSKFASVDKNDTIWKAMSIMPKTINLLRTCLMLSIIGEDGALLNSPKKQIGTPITVNCGKDADGKPRRDFALSRIPCDYEESRVVVEGAGKLRDQLNDLDPELKKWVCKKVRENDFTVLPAGVYDLEVVSFKDTPTKPGSPGKYGFVIRPVGEDSRTYVAFRKDQKPDMIICAQLAKALPTDEKKYVGSRFKALIGELDLRNGGTINTIEKVYLQAGDAEPASSASEKTNDDDGPFAEHPNASVETPASDEEFE